MKIMITKSLLLVVVLFAFCVMAFAFIWPVWLIGGFSDLSILSRDASSMSRLAFSRWEIYDSALWAGPPNNSANRSLVIVNRSR